MASYYSVYITHKFYCVHLMSSGKGSGRSLQDILNSQVPNRGNGREGKGGGRRDGGRRSGGGGRDRRDFRKIPVNKVVDIPSNIPPTLDEKQFPQLLVSKNDIVEKTTMLDYKNVFSLIDINPLSDSTKTMPGWTLIDTNTKKMTTYNKCGRVVDYSNSCKDNDLTHDQIYTLYRSMSERWCNYYDEINELLGDRSPHINYKAEIEAIVKEDEELFKHIYQDINDYSSSDDDLNNLDD